MTFNTTARKENQLNGMTQRWLDTESVLRSGQRSRKDRFVPYTSRQAFEQSLTKDAVAQPTPLVDELIKNCFPQALQRTQQQPPSPQKPKVKAPVEAAVNTRATASAAESIFMKKIRLFDIGDMGDDNYYFQRMSLFHKQLAFPIIEGDFSELYFVADCTRSMVLRRCESEEKSVDTTAVAISKKHILAGTRTGIYENGEDDTLFSYYDKATARVIGNHPVESKEILYIAPKDDETTYFSHEESIMRVDYREGNPDANAIGVPHACSIDFPAGNTTICAAGSNKKFAAVWDERNPSKALHIFEHDACVKGLKFNPVMPNLLATAAGDKDKHVRLFDIASGEEVAKIELDAQINHLSWNAEGTHLFVTQGWPIHGTVDVIRYTKKGRLQPVEKIHRPSQARWYGANTVVDSGVFVTYSSKSPFEVFTLKRKTEITQIEGLTKQMR